MKPQLFYRKVFRRVIDDLAPASLLDVGSGSGQWVNDMRAAGIDARGVDTSAAIGWSNPFVTTASAIDLPFEDNSVDLVTSQFSAHHFESLAAHLAEATRIARQGVVILDYWYDDTVASQRNTRRLDECLKQLDRDAGDTHHDTYRSGDFVAAMPNGVEADIEIRHLLRLQPLAADELDARVARRRERHSDNADGLAKLDACLADAGTEGFSTDGAIIFAARLSG